MAIGITTKYLPATDYKPARIKARTSEGKTLTLSRDGITRGNLDGEAPHKAVAHDLAVRAFMTDNVELGDGVFCNLPSAEWAFKAWVAGPKLPKIISISGKRWFRKTYGNTYTSVAVSIDGKPVFYSGPTGGYGQMYEQIACQWLEDNGYLPGKEKHESLWAYCERMGVTLVDNVADVAREKDL